MRHKPHTGTPRLFSSSNRSCYANDFWFADFHYHHQGIFFFVDLCFVVGGGGEQGV